MMWRGVVTTMVAGLALAGCQTTGGNAPAAASAADRERSPGYVRPTDAQALDAARQAVAAKLKDPESARFSDIARKTTPNLRGEPTDTVCGRVNAKNAFGGYIGVRPFAYLVAADIAVLSEEAAGPTIIAAACPELIRR